LHALRQERWIDNFVSGGRVNAVRLKTQSLVAAFSLTAFGSTFGQGTFQNLDFEAAQIVVPFTFANALPGWTGYIGTNPTVTLYYNGITLGDPAISLHDSASSLKPIQGSYSVILQGKFNPLNVPGLPGAAIAQTGQIPLTAKSLFYFSGSESMQVTFGGQPIPWVAVGIQPNGANRYLILGADISSFAGQTGELRFTMPSVAFSFNNPYLDNIQFSDQPIPEPSVFGLFALGALLLGWRFLKRTS